jgi:hypothetical protein
MRQEETMKSKILFKSLLSLLVALSVLACSRPYSLSNLPSTRVVPYQLKLEFSSALEDLYYVLSGPAFSYGRFPVNARLSALLKEQTQQQSSPRASSLVVLKVHVEQLKTEFDEIGQNRPAEPVLVAMAWPSVPGGGWSFLASDYDRQDDFPLPEETHKRAQMTLSLQLERAGQLLGEKKVKVEHTASHYWYYESLAFADYYRYSYEPVLDEIFRKVLAEAGTFVEQTLGV